mmetsp:Transcript_5572/g.17480  ORF Transcript_5572/g.17480 Transcript_5572/m.17480 type:complete len:206 (-) Transcript_5572:25-642(-)
MPAARVATMNPARSSTTNAECELTSAPWPSTTLRACSSVRDRAPPHLSSSSSRAPSARSAATAERASSPTRLGCSLGEAGAEAACQPSPAWVPGMKALADSAEDSSPVRTALSAPFKRSSCRPNRTLRLMVPLSSRLALWASPACGSHLSCSSPSTPKGADSTSRTRAASLRRRGMEGTPIKFLRPGEGCTRASWRWSSFHRGWG